MLHNKADAEDVTQEMLIKIWKNVNCFNILSAKAWIIKSTHNLCVDCLRKRKAFSYKECSIDDYLSESIMDCSSVNDPQNITHIKMLTSRVKETIQLLPEKLKSVFVLYEIQGLRYKEISKVLDMPINSVKVYLFRARKQLQKELKCYEEHEIV